jgi:hypothetical protein
MVMVMMMMIKHEYKRGTVLGASVEGVERVLEVNRFEEHSIVKLTKYCLKKVGKERRNTI